MCVSERGVFTFNLRQFPVVGFLLFFECLLPLSLLLVEILGGLVSPLLVALGAEIGVLLCSVIVAVKAAMPMGKYCKQLWYYTKKEEKENI